MLSEVVKYTMKKFWETLKGEARNRVEEESVNPGSSRVSTEPKIGTRYEVRTEGAFLIRNGKLILAKFEQFLSGVILGLFMFMFWFCSGSVLISQATDVTFISLCFFCVSASRSH